ncbi:MAG: hypothetical protein M1536_00835, partial [Firmicutes bacterium]|nr:hypothetical protein [Bacillota bacterium]
FFFLLIFITIIIAAVSVPSFATITCRIDYPETNGYLYGNVKIAGAAQSTGTFNSYIIEVQKQPGGAWQTVAQGNTQIPANGQRDILGLWQTGNGSFPAGVYTIRLTVYAEGTNAIYTVNNITLGTCTYVNTVSVNPVKFNPYAGQTTTVSYNLPAAGDVTIKFYDTSKNVVDTKSLGSQPAGPQNLVWTGRTGSTPASAVPDNGYTLSIKVYHSSDLTTQIYYPSDGEVTVTPTNITISPTFRAELNQLCEIGYTIDRPCWVRVAMGSPQLVWAYLHGSYDGSTWLPQLAGSHTDYWNGRKGVLGILGQVIVFLPQVQALIWANSLPDNVMITEGKIPQVTNLQANPPIIDLTSGQGTDLSYALSRDMNVTIKIYTYVFNQGDMQYVRTLINNQPRTVGAHTEHWDGLSDAGLYGAAPYPYTFIIEAVDADGIPAERKYGSIVVKGY